MIPIAKTLKGLMVLALMLMACSKKNTRAQDEIYSRHLQEHVKLDVISTPLPDDKGQMNLLLLNDGQDMDKLKVNETLTDLYKRNLIQPIIIVGIKSADPASVYGVAGQPDYKNRGSRAKKYADFIDNELYAFIKKRTGVRKFNSVAIAGCALGAVSAVDIAWNHADKIDRVGAFSGSFEYSLQSPSVIDYSNSTERILLNAIRVSRKKPHLKYWFYGEAKANKDMQHIDSGTVNHTADLVQLIKNKNVCPPGDIVFIDSTEGKHGYTYWSEVFPDFLIWAFGKN